MATYNILTALPCSNNKKEILLFNKKAFLPKNVIYNGIQEGITFNLFLFTETTTGSTFGVKKGKKLTFLDILKRSEKLKAAFKMREKR